MHVMCAALWHQLHESSFVGVGKRACTLTLGNVPFGRLTSELQ